MLGGGNGFGAWIELPGRGACVRVCMQACAGRLCIHTISRVLTSRPRGLHAFAHTQLKLAHTDGGLFGSVTDGKEAWFGVDGYPAKVVRIRLGLSAVEVSSDFSQVASGDKVGDLKPMEEVSRLDFLPEEERLWSLTAEPMSERTATSWFAYAGVGNPPGRLVKIDLLKMQRVGYVQLSDKDIRAGKVLKEHAYFVTSSKPATVLRCPLHDMFHGDTFHPVEVTLALGEHQFSQKKIFPIRGVNIVNIVGH